MVGSYNKKRESLTQTTDRYLELLNGFLVDSDKTVSFSGNGYISFSIGDVKGERPVASLSGEAQIFVILTHLVFNPIAQGANVFIVDEPELSLHVQWQELFVDSIISANPNIQYVMATHSPSIILEKVDKCIDLASRPAKKKR